MPALLLGLAALHFALPAIGVHVIGVQLFGQFLASSCCSVFRYAWASAESLFCTGTWQLQRLVTLPVHGIAFAATLQARAASSCCVACLTSSLQLASGPDPASAALPPALGLPEVPPALVPPLIGEPPEPTLPALAPEPPLPALAALPALAPLPALPGPPELA